LRSNLLQVHGEAAFERYPQLTEICLKIADDSASLRLFKIFLDALFVLP
jgi:hypothetical protein